ncbi:glycosyltransferase [Gulosibacter chungangensis]|uniref:4,4'-diaponeurosporenoate glycosyltransferase n=1 Tax=Gulosibacter chungangensis TaxID=979746 RepID=A0A7J5B7J9_9MICO|nr:glycosyltransferase [Gulosibacter chungangensis]KAB1640845.1 glycosyltransferase [Gulosibacter chungangensis]
MNEPASDGRYMLHVLSAVAVVIPARDEAELIGEAVRAALTSMSRAEQTHGVRSILTVVFDSCVDDSERVAIEAAAGDARAEFLSIAAGKVGRARAVGVRHALERLGEPLPNVWLANTDADSAVPEEWVSTQLTFARNGVAAVLGTIEPDRHSVMNAHTREWATRYRPIDGHGHIHGANLGVRADAYVATGGFANVSSDEDVRLARSLADLGFKLVSTKQAPVATSFRTGGRAPHGFAEFLQGIRSSG